VASKSTIVSALGVVLKSSGAIRLIHDASRPLGKALNDYAAMEYKQKFQTLEDAKSMLSFGCYMVKIDLKSAYRYVAVHPEDYGATGWKWRFKGESHDTYLVDKHLPFGPGFRQEFFTG
jgi:hypothetical protein